MKTFLEYLRRLIFGPIVSSVIIGLGWQWYHLPRDPQGRFVLAVIFLSSLVLIIYTIIKRLFRFFTLHFERHPFWADEFFYLLDNLFFVASLYFVIFFSQNEIFSLIYFGLVSLALFILCDRYLGLHPAKGWRKVWRIFFILTAFIFVIQTFFQYFAFDNYILDPNIRFFNIVLFRSIAMSAFWLSGFAIAGLLYVYLGKKTRFALLIVWSLLFIFSILVGLANVGVLYHTNLYLNPIVFLHAGSGGWQVYLFSFIILTGIFIILSTVAIFVVSAFFRTHRLTPHHIWFYFDLAVIFLAFVIILGVASLRNTPEAIIIKSFYEYWRGGNQEVVLHPVVNEKLKKFGIYVDPDNFYVNSHNQIYVTSTKLLPDKFDLTKPNIAIVFLESYSARLSGVYNDNLVGLTPGLEEMANDSNSTVFKNYFSASTPTITGLMSQLCSILPPTGHNEIEQSKQLQKHKLYCLPEILLKNGYQSTGYITAVAKNFANKDSILNSMGVQNIWGTKELSSLISGEPLSWGYSDHQMFPVFFEQMKIEQAKNNQPFLMMISTVNTHPPFNLSKDLISYHGDNDYLLDAIHTTDNAFMKFWRDFKNSELAKNTIVIAVADHAVFPNAYEKKNFPDFEGKMTYYDDVVFIMYIPDNVLPAEVSTYSSFLDFTPTLMHLLNINKPNVFEGHSIFDQREKYPNLLGMHEFGLWINQEISENDRRIDYSPPASLNCVNSEIGRDPIGPLTLCEFQNYFQWKRLMFEQGRLWMPQM